MRDGRLMPSLSPSWLSSKRTLRTLVVDVMLVVLARCEGLRIVWEEREELRESDLESMVVLAPNSSRKPALELLAGEPLCKRASRPSRLLEARLRIGRGLASTLCVASEVDPKEEDAVRSWSDVRR